MARCVEKVNRFWPIPTSSTVIQQWKQEKRGDKRVTQWKEEANRRRGRTRLKRVESIGYWLVECCGLGDALREGTVPITIRIEGVTRWLKSTWETEGKKKYIFWRSGINRTILKRERWSKEWKRRIQQDNGYTMLRERVRHIVEPPPSFWKKNFLP